MKPTIEKKDSLNLCVHSSREFLLNFERMAKPRGTGDEKFVRLLPKKRILILGPKIIAPKKLVPSCPMTMTPSATTQLSSP
jgi:hypothetical protein